VQFDGPVLELLSPSRLRSHPLLCTLGPDILGERFDCDRFLSALRAGEGRDRSERHCSTRP
jgi:hypothetical protein